MAFTHRRRASTNKSHKNNASKRTSSKVDYIKGCLKTKDFDNLKATVRVQLTEDTNRKSKRVAWGSLVLGGCFVVYINVYEGKNGYFISYPNYQDDDGEYHNLVYCFDREVIEGLTALITDMIDGDEDDEADEADEADEDDEDLPF